MERNVPNLLLEQKNKKIIPPLIPTPPIFCTVDFGFGLLHPHSPTREAINRRRHPSRELPTIPK